MNLHPGSTAGQVSRTDFGRQVNGAVVPSLAEALRERAGRTARVEAFRYQLAMGLIGFIGGLVLVIPAVLWLAPPGPADARWGPRPPAGSAEIRTTSSASKPVLAAAPSIAERQRPVAATPALPEPEPVTPAQVDEMLMAARTLIRSGQVLGARRVLERRELQSAGEALFMLAETYDPNVLAALGATGVLAEATMARRHYEAALAKGVVAAAHRLEALE